MVRSGSTDRNGQGGWFNIKMTSSQYRKSHCGDKTILWPSYLHNGVSYTGKMASLYWIRAQTRIGFLSFGWSKLNYAQPITGQVTEVTCPVIGRAQPELTPSKRQKTGPGSIDRDGQRWDLDPSTGGLPNSWNTWRSTENRSCHDANFVIITGNTECHNNLWCHQWQQISHHNNSWGYPPQFDWLTVSEQNCQHFAENILKWIFLNESCCILGKILLKFVPKGSITQTPVSGSFCLPLGVLQSMWATWCKI